MAKWTKDDKAALRRLVDRHGAADVHGRAAKIEAELLVDGKEEGAVGRPRRSEWDCFAAWVSIELLRRRGLGEKEAREKLASRAEALNPGVKGYSAESLKKLYGGARSHFKRHPEDRAHWDNLVASLADRAPSDFVHLPRLSTFRGALWAGQGSRRSGKK